MKNFIRKTLIFLILSGIIVMSIIITSYWIVKRQSSFKIDQNITSIIIGHSQSECALDDSILDHSINLSASGESYFYNYIKLKEVIEDNKQIKNVFIEFSNNQVDSLMDDWIWGYNKMSYRLQFYAPFMSFKDMNVLIDNNPTDFIASYSVSTRKFIYRILKNDYYFVDEIGGYLEIKESHVEDIIENNKFDSSISADHTLSDTNIKYLKKMISLCREHYIDVYFIRSPFHPLYEAYENEHVFQSVYKNNFEDIKFLDFKNLIFPNDYYLDLQHLNYKGAEEYTSLLNHLLEENILDSPHMQNIIDHKIEKENLKYKLKHN